MQGAGSDASPLTFPASLIIMRRTKMSDSGGAPRQRSRANGGTWWAAVAAALGLRAPESRGHYTARSTSGGRPRSASSGRRHAGGTQARPRSNNVPYAIVLLVIVGALGGFGYLALSWAVGAGPQPVAGSSNASLVAPPPSAPTPVPSPSPSPGPTQLRSYVVKQGDTPGEIARQYGVTVEALLQANAIQDPRSLQVGQRLQIPPSR